MAIGNLFQGIDSPGEIDSAIELIPRRRPHVLDEKSIPASKIEVSWAMADSIPYLVVLGSYLVPSQPPKATSKIEPQLKRRPRHGFTKQSFAVIS